MAEPLDETRLWRLLDAVAAIAQRAGQRIRQVQAGGYQVAHKADQSPVTTADLAAHETILSGLTALEPRLPVLSEESEATIHAQRHRWTTYWLVDPLDGTRGFIRGDGEYSVNIALIRDHVPVLGVVHTPATGRLWLAAHGLGAWRLADGRRTPIRTRPAPGVPVVAGSRSHGRPCLERFLRLVGPHREIRMSSIAKACLVAEGSADLYPRFGPTSEWDTAAAQCILEQAGGALTDFQGRPLQYNRGTSLENPPFVAVGDPTAGWIPILARANLECRGSPEATAPA